MNKVDSLGVQVDKVDMEQALNRILEFLKEDKAHAVYTPNSEIIMQAYRNQAFRDVLNTADLITPDGIGVVYASRICLLYTADVSCEAKIFHSGSRRVPPFEATCPACGENGNQPEKYRYRGYRESY